MIHIKISNFVINSQQASNLKPSARLTLLWNAIMQDYILVSKICEIFLFNLD